MTTSIPTWANAADGQTTSDGGVKGAGKAALIHEAGTDNQYCGPLDRFPAGPSPEPKELGQLVISPDTQFLIDGLNPFAEEDVTPLTQSVRHFAQGAHVLGDIQGGVEVGLGLLRDNGWLPETATYAMVDDLLATNYQSTADQAMAKLLRTMGAAIAAGEAADQVFSWMTAMGPQGQDFALRIARRAGQAVDVAHPDALGLWRHIYE